MSRSCQRQVAGLFVADSVGSLLDSGYAGGVFWDLRNGWNTTGNNSLLLYVWRQGGDEGLVDAGAATGAGGLACKKRSTIAGSGTPGLAR